MSVPAPRLVPERKPGGDVPPATWLTLALLPLVTIAAVAGLCLPDVYREPAAIVPAMRGQDLVTLLVVLLLAVSVISHRRGSARGTLVWFGLLGYLLYTYTGAALAYYVNRFTLLYVAAFTLSGFALTAALVGADAAQLQARFDTGTPRRAVIAFLCLIALLLGALEIGQNVSYLRTGALPASVRLSGGGHYYVYGLDLGIVVPLSLLTAYWLWRRARWGFVCAGILLIKAATMGSALLAMNMFARGAGQPIDAVELLAFYGVLAVGGFAIAVWFLRHCRP